MKEYQSTTGGRYIFNEDMHNLQDLALSMTKMFKSANRNFVISGCEITVVEENEEFVVSISSGFAYINGKIVTVETYSDTFSSIRKIWISLASDDGPNIMYADSSQHPQYINYYGDIKINYTPPSLPPDSYWNSVLMAAQDDDGNWAFPDVRTGYFKAHGLLNEDVIKYIVIDIPNCNTIDLDTPKLFTIDSIPAQVRILSDRSQYIGSRLTEGERNDGAVAIIYNDELEEFLSGRFSISELYLHSNCTFKWAVAMPNATKGDDIADAFVVRTSDLTDGETASLSLSSDIVDDVAAAMGDDAIGLYLWLVAGDLDSQSVCKSYPEILYFGKCKYDRPSKVYKFCKDLKASGNKYVSLGASSWNSLSSDEKYVWKPIIDDGGITGSMIKNEAVTVNKIANGAVTANKLAPDALICNISSYMTSGESVLPMGKIYMYGVYPLEVRTCRITSDGLPTLVLAWYRGDENDPTSSYPNPYMLFVYIMAEGASDYVYDGSYTWDSAPEIYKKIYTPNVLNGSVTLVKLADDAKAAFWKRPLVYDQDNVRLSGTRLNLERLRGPLSIEPVLGEEDMYVLRILAPTLTQFTNLVARVEALENANNS